MFHQFYLDESSADVHFVFESENIKLPANKVLLAAKSDVFRAMFFGGLKEEGDVLCKDVPAVVFVDFLRYFYFEEVNLSTEIVDWILYLGRKYLVKRCVDDCVEFFAKSLNNESVCATLDRALFYDIEALLKMCTDHISVNTSAVFGLPAFMECTQKAFDHILKMDVLSCGEIDVFITAIKWVQTKSGKKDLFKADIMQHLGDLYHQIRFASMTIEELCSLANMYGAVLQSDFMAFASMIATKAAPENYSQFNMKPRNAQWKADSVKCSFQNGSPRLYRFSKEFVLKMTTSKPIILGGLKCGRVGTLVDRAFKDLETLVNVDVEIFEARDFDSLNGNSLQKFRAKLHSIESDILLPYPILIRHGYAYIITIHGLPDGHIFQSDYLKTSVTLQPNVEISVKLPKASFGNGVGLIQALAVNHL